ncbi:MAG: hypothetical protein FJ279_06740 [Planctomycetes bacterium]|nr:hypothetical protein [Planctomycetota bacterium]
MNRRELLSAVVMLVLAAASCSKAESGKPAKAPSKPAAPATLFDAATGGRILINAADAVKVDPPMVMVDDKTAAKGKHIWAPEGPDDKEISIGGSATFKFDAAEPGDYILWVRANWHCSCGNSVNVAIDGAEPTAVGEDGTYQRWHWVKKIGKTFKLTQGAHTMVVGNREDGAKFDQVLLTKDKDYIPVDIEQ